MPKTELSENLVKKLRADPEVPDGRREVLYFDTHKDAARGFGLRVTLNGAASYFLGYRVHGRQRRYTIGASPDWKLPRARAEGRRLRTEVDQGRDPLAERREERARLSVAELCEHYLEHHARAHKRPSSVEEDERMVRLYVEPLLGRKQVDDIRPADVRRAYLKVKSRAPYRANRLLALLGKMWTLAVREDAASEHVVRVARSGLKDDGALFEEQRRERWLSREEIARLLQALDARAKHERSSVNAVKLMLLTGCRRGEALRARWSDLDLERGVWTKPSHHTKQKRTERLPLSGTALAFLHALQAESEGEVLFPGPTGAPLGDVKHFWQSVRRKAELEGVRLHDLRHSFASHLVSDGESLHVVGKLLGHTQAATTMRYAHVADDALRSASDKMGRVFADAQATARGEEVPDNVEPLHSKTRR